MISLYFYGMDGKIRIAFLTEIGKIMEIADATWKLTYAPIISAEQIEYMYERSYTSASLKEQMQNGTTFLLYLENEIPLGFAAYEFRESGIIYVPKIYVRPDHQKRHIGRKLLERVEDIGMKNNCSILELNVNRKNPAMYFYKKIGFEMHEKVDLPFGKFWLNDYVLRKKIGG